MDGPQLSVAFPRPGRALWSVLIAMAALGIVTALLSTWGGGASVVFSWLVYYPSHALWQPWRLLTSGLLTSPESWGHLLFALVGLYFLGAPLEKRWGAWRFVRFLALSVILGNLTTMLVERLFGDAVPERFHPAFVFGPAAAITAIAVAWAREYSDSTVQLFMVLPIRGRVLLWITIGFCVLDLVYPAGMPEGVVAPFGGLVAGLLFGGSPSLARTTWLHLRLALLRRQSTTVRVDDMLSRKAPRRPRPGAPPLRVVPGGLEEVLKKRTPPKDKRYLN
jgi:membrane associated rhomboid family serine protease